MTKNQKLVQVIYNFRPSMKTKELIVKLLNGIYKQKHDKKGFKGKITTIRDGSIDYWSILATMLFAG